MSKLQVLDLFSAAAGGWSLGMHRAGFETMAACEYIAWRRALYQENNPGVRIYDDVRTLTAGQLLRDFGFLPDIIVGSPPCQDISSANTKGKGVEGERSGLYFEAVRIIRECRPRWFALENSSNLRTRGADAVLAALETLGYTVWAFVVGAGDVGANHERKRSWLIGFDADQIANSSSWEQREQPRRRNGQDWTNSAFNRGDDQTEHGDANGQRRAARVCSAPDERQNAYSGRRLRQDADARGDGLLHASDPDGDRRHDRRQGRRGGLYLSLANDPQKSGSVANADQAGQADGCVVSSLRQTEIAVDGRSIGRGDDRKSVGQVGGGESSGLNSSEPWADWNRGITHHLRVDAGISPWVASARIAVGGPKGTSGASLIVEAFGDSVVPQIPEAIGRAIIRVETALRTVAA